MATSNKNDQRKQKRKNLIFYLKIHDEKTGNIIGHMANITTQGIMIVSENPLDIGSVLTLKMELPETYHLKKEIMFVAEVHWCQKDVNPHYYAIGLKFNHIAKDQLDIIAELIPKYLFND